MNTMIYKVFSFIAVALMSMQLFAGKLPLYNGCKVICVEFNQWGDYRWRGHLRMIDKHGRECLAQVFPNYENSFSDSAYEYYLNNMADIPIRPKTKLKNVDAEDQRQIWIKRKQDAMKKREQQAKEAHERLTKATTMYARLNTLFGYKIGTVVDMSKLDEKKEAKPMAWLALWFKPDKTFLTFNEYSLRITPSSHRICVIEALAPYSKQTLELAKAALEKKFSDTMRYDGGSGEYHILGVNGKGNGRVLTLKKEGNMLRLALADLKGIELAGKEYEQQKDKVSSDAIDAL